MGELLEASVRLRSILAKTTCLHRGFRVLREQFFVDAIMVGCYQLTAGLDLVTLVVFLELVEPEAEDFEGLFEAVEHEEDDQDEEEDRQIGRQVVAEYGDDSQVAYALSERGVLCRMRFARGLACCPVA